MQPSQFGPQPGIVTRTVLASCLSSYARQPSLKVTVGMTGANDLAHFSLTAVSLPKSLNPCDCQPAEVQPEQALYRAVRVPRPSKVKWLLPGAFFANAQVVPRGDEASCARHDAWSALSPREKSLMPLMPYRSVGKGGGCVGRGLDTEVLAFVPAKPFKKGAHHHSHASGQDVRGPAALSQAIWAVHLFKAAIA